MRHYSGIKLVFNKLFRFKSSQINKQIYFDLGRDEINTNFQVPCLRKALVYSTTRTQEVHDFTIGCKCLMTRCS